MKSRHLLASVALASASVGSEGCLISASAIKNIANDAAIFSSDVHMAKRFRRTAAAVWEVEHPTDPVRAKSKDYRAGFIDGYVDFLENGQPPGSASAPRVHYTRNHMLTPDGHARAELYLEGYAHGVSQAEASGERGVLVVPGGAAGPPLEPPPVVLVAPAPALLPGAARPVAPRPAGEPLPAPRPDQTPTRPTL